MKIESTYSPSDNKVIFTVESNLFTKYYPNFSTLLNDCDKLPKGITTEKGGEDNQVKIQFPLPEESEVKTLGRNSSLAAVSINVKDVNAINDFLDDFTNTALRYELKRTEFIPLEGYPVDNLHEEIVDAVKNKRNLCIIENFKQYQERDKNEYKFNQYIIQYGTEEYADAVLMIYNKDLEKLSKVWKDRLSLTEWY